MSPEMKAKWLDALKSGIYPKAQHRLKTSKSNGEGYCCLGVLIAACGPGFYGDHDQEPRALPNGEAPNADNELSLEGRRYFGLEHIAHDDLICLNDKTHTFEEVIEYIEKNV